MKPSKPRECSKIFQVLHEKMDSRRLQYEILLQHGSLVAAKALQGARYVAALKPDRQFIYEAALVHDIGMILTHAPAIDCFGKAPYIQHGIIGSGLLKQAGLMRHASVCETHVGVGITRADIERNKLPLPKKDFLPQNLEEELIAWADKFYSKKPGKMLVEKPVEVILKQVSKHGPEKADLFRKWHLKFTGQSL